MAIAAKDAKVKAGYKLTEVGVIPEDWIITTLGEIANVKTGPFGSALHEKDYVDDGTPIITVEHLSEQGIVHMNLPMVSDLDRKRLNAYSLLEGDIVFSRVGSVDRNSLVKEKESGWLFSGRLLRIRLKSSNIDTAFLSYYFSQEPTKQRIRSVAVGQTMASLNTQILKNISIAFPASKFEQQAIATTLSDMDALITSLDKLITKKRDIKQATMQQLLTGKMRLPGFSGEWKLGYKQTKVRVLPVDWEVHTLRDEIDQLEAGISVNSVDEDFHIYAHEQAILKTSAVSNGNFFPDENKKIAPRDIKRARLSPRAGSIIISRMNTPDLVGECGYVDKDYLNLFLPDRLWMIRLKKASKINAKWLRYLLSYKEYKIKIKEAATGTSGSMKNISKDSLLSINIPFPEPEEQQAIATVLSDMDAEIVALEKKRDKYRALKQGMMQELLTGKTRLVGEMSRR